MPIIELASWSLEATMFDGDEAAGPVPVLFSEDPESTKRGVASNLVKAHHDIQKVVRCFMMPETVRLEEATALIKRPRLAKSL
jgi:hypothetical protein